MTSSQTRFVGRGLIANWRLIVQRHRVSSLAPLPFLWGTGRRRRGGGVLLLLLLALAAHAGPTPGRPTVTFPDAGTYAYWVQSQSGAVSTMPVTLTGHNQIALATPAVPGDVLYVLDKHTGSVATVPLAAPTSGTAKAVILTVGDFKPLASGNVTPAAPQPPAPSATTPQPAPEAGSGLARLFTVFFGLLVAAGVVWVLLHLYRTRGQPLITAARRLGVDVPDPASPDAEPEAAPVYTPPAPRPVEKIPEEAGAVPPPPAAPARRATVGTLEAPQIVGIQGIAAGSSFTVPPGEVVIGRDGDNDIVLAEGTVSRRHARLARDGDGRITLTDEDSANGVFVNGKRITQAILAAGDQIQIGDSYFRLEA